MFCFCPPPCRTEGPLDEYRFNMFMRDLLTEKAKDIFRCKGVLYVHVSGGWHGLRLRLRLHAHVPSHLPFLLPWPRNPS